MNAILNIGVSLVIMLLGFALYKFVRNKTTGNGDIKLAKTYYRTYFFIAGVVAVVMAVINYLWLAGELDTGMHAGLSMHIANWAGFGFVFFMGVWAMK